MSDFKCPVVRVEIEAHPNADAIELARVGDYQCIVRKGDFKSGDLAVYIPEQAIVPDWLLTKMGLTGKLAGGAKNRVKAIKLRGIVSQGLLLEFHSVLEGEAPEISVINPEKENKEAFFLEGADASEHLGIVKYEPTLPSFMAGRVVGSDFNATIKYDFDNIKSKPNLFEDGELVSMSEKVHGTFMVIGFVPLSAMNEKYYKGRVIMSSKGMSAKGFALDHLDENNVYAQACMKFGLLDVMHDELSKEYAIEDGDGVYLLGEVFGVAQNGKAIQDMTYGQIELRFLAFDMAIGRRDHLKYIPDDEFRSLMAMKGVGVVPRLYHGPYSKEAMLSVTDGKETISGSEVHIREGVVVKSAYEIPHPHYGRKIAKSVSSDYLLRKSKDATEFN